MSRGQASAPLTLWEAAPPVGGRAARLVSHVPVAVSLAHGLLSGSGGASVVAAALTVYRGR